MNTNHTRAPWGIEKTRLANYIGPLRDDGKINEIVVFNDRGKDLKQKASDKADANAELIVLAVNAYVENQKAIAMIAECLGCPPLIGNIALAVHDLVAEKKSAWACVGKLVEDRP